MNVTILELSTYTFFRSLSTNSSLFERGVEPAYRIRFREVISFNEVNDFATWYMCSSLSNNKNL